MCVRLGAAWDIVHWKVSVFSSTKALPSGASHISPFPIWLRLRQTDVLPHNPPLASIPEG